MTAKKKDNHEDRAHAPLPPSASERWLACPPSQGYIKRLIAEKVIKKRVSGAAAERGTRIHELGEQFVKWLLIKKKIDSFSRGDPGEIAEARAYAYFCMEKLEELKLLYGDNVVCGAEDKGVLVDGVCWGSRDFWALARGKRTHLVVVDLKTGKEPVDPKDNTQEIIYAADLVEQHKPDTIELCIYQPNAMDTQLPERSHTYKRAEFDDFVRKIRVGVGIANKWIKAKSGHEKDLVAGDHCGWCDALAVCAKAREKSLEISSKNFQPVPIDRTSLPSTAVLEADQVSEILKRVPMFSAWLEAVQVRALELMHKGKTVPGFKVVQKITRRAWEGKYTDAQIAKGIGLPMNQLTKTIRLSPAQVEEKLDKAKKAKLQRFVFKPEGDPVVVADTDRRIPLLATKINFTPVSNEEEDDG